MQVKLFIQRPLISGFLPEDWCEHAGVVFIIKILSFLWSCNWTLCSRESARGTERPLLNRSWAMKSVGFVFQAALPSLRAVCGDLSSRIFISGLLCAEMGLLCSVPQNVGIIFTLCTADDFKMPFCGVQAGISVWSLKNWGVAVPHSLCWTAESCITQGIWDFCAVWNLYVHV